MTEQFTAFDASMSSIKPEELAEYEGKVAKITLAPCPYCGNSPQVSFNVRGWRIACRKYHGAVKYGSTIDSMVGKWNVYCNEVEK